MKKNWLILLAVLLASLPALAQWDMNPSYFFPQKGPQAGGFPTTGSVSNGDQVLLLRTNAGAMQFLAASPSVVAGTSFQLQPAATLQSTNDIPASTDWQSIGELTPSLWWNSYYSAYLQANGSNTITNGYPVGISNGYAMNTYQITNAVQFFKSNGISIDFYNLDQADSGVLPSWFLAEYTNGVSWSTNQTGQALGWNLLAYPEGPSWLANYVQTNGSKLRLWLTRGTGGIGATYTNIFNNVKTISGWGMDGLTVDHTGLPNNWNGLDLSSANTNPVPRYLYDRWFFSQLAAAQIGLFGNNYSGSTDLYGNLNRTRPFNLTVYGLGYWDPEMDMANEFLVDGGGNTFGPGSSSDAQDTELSFETFIDQHTNLASWVRPGHTVLYNTVQIATTASLTNIYNACIEEAYSFAVGYSGYINNPSVLADLQNQELRTIWKDPLVKMGLVVSNWPVASGGVNGGGATVAQLWSRPLKDSRYAILLWNRSTNTSAMINFNFGTISPALASGAVTIHDPWSQSDLTTTTSGSYSTTLVPCQMRLLTVYAAPSGTVANQTVTSGLNIWLPLTDGTGTNCSDFSGNNSAGLNVNTNWTTQGLFGPAFLADGSHDVVISSNQVSGVSFTNLSVSAWFACTNVASYGMVFSRGSGANAGGYCVSFTAANTAYWYLYTTNVPAGTSTTVPSVTDGKWHNVTITYDGSNARLYLDASLQATIPRTGIVSASPPFANANQTEIGGRQGGSFFNYGKIANFKLWNRALSQSEIGQLYNAISTR